MDKKYDEAHALIEYCAEGLEKLAEEDAYRDMREEDERLGLAIEDGSAFSRAAAIMGRKGGKIGGKSKSLVKQEAARTNLIRARLVKYEKKGGV